MNSRVRLQERNHKHEKASTYKRKSVRDGISCETQSKTVQETGKAREKGNVRVGQQQISRNSIKLREEKHK